MRSIPIHTRNRDTATAASIFDHLTKQYPEIKHLEVQLGTGPRASWTKVLEENLHQAGLNIHFLSEPKEMNFSPGRPIPFIIAGFIPSLSCPTDIFRVFQEGGGWVGQLNQPDKQYHTLLNAPISLESENALAQRFYDENYAIPLFETAPRYCYNQSTILGMNELEQAFDVYLDKIIAK
jgi:hypothetical protein